MGFIDNIFKIVGTFHGDLQRLADSIDNQNESRTKAAASQQHRDIPQPLSIIVPEGIENRKSAADSKADSDYQGKNLLWQRWTFFALVVYAIVTILIYCANRKAAQAAQDTFGEIQKQTKLQRQQVVGLQGAVVRVEQPNFEPNKVTVFMTNTGVVNAIHANINGEIFAEALPRENRIGDPIPVEVHDVIVDSKQGFSQAHQVAWIPATVPLNQWPGALVVFFKGKFTYDNGFGDVSTSRDFCYMWLPRWNVEYKGMGSGGGGFQSGCDLKKILHSPADTMRFLRHHHH